MISKKVSQSSSRTRSSQISVPTPMEFDLFVPWVCVNWQNIFTVTVTRLDQESYERQQSSGRSGVKIIKNDPRLLNATTPKSTPQTETTTPRMTSSFSYRQSCETKYDNIPVIPVNAYYDPDNNLVEVAILNAPFQIHKKIIQAFNLCMNFHPHLTKLRIRRSGLTSELIHEISRLLLHSNLTQICLDDTIVPEGNYDILLEQNTSLQHLSLNRCSINDKVCANICKQIASGHRLVILELSSNFISGGGAISLANLLRKNRCLRHLNLSGNQITDEGASAIISNLMEFTLTTAEVTETRRLFWDYLINKNKIHEEVLQRLALNVLNYKHLKVQSLGLGSMSNLRESEYIKELANRMVNEDVKEFEHPFQKPNVVFKDSSIYCLGNFMLNSINIAFNDLGYLTLVKVNNVLRYQRSRMFCRQFGLLKINLAGNNIPPSDPVLDSIQYYLGEALRESYKGNAVPRSRYVGKSQSSGSSRISSRVLSKVKSNKTKK